MDEVPLLARDGGFVKSGYHADLDELKKLEIDENADMDEYVYFNGRMMKRSILLKLKNEALEEEDKKETK